MQHKFNAFLASLHGALIVLMLLGIPVAFLFPDQPVYWLRACIILPVFFVSALAVHYVRHLAVYLLAAVLCTGALFLFGNTIPEKLYLVAAALVVFLSRIPARIHGDKDLLESPSLFSLIMFGIIYLAGIVLKSETLCGFAFRLAFCYVINLILYTNLSNMEDYLTQNHDIANIPGRQILSTNRIMLCIFSVISLAAMFLLPASGLSQLFYRLGDALWWLIRAFFSLFRKEGAEEIVPETAAPMPAQENPSMELPPPNGPNWLTAILNFLSFVFAAAIFIGLAAGLVYCIIKLFRNFYKPIRENDDKQEFIKEEKADTSARAQKAAAEPSLFFSFSPDAVIRKAYKKAIKKGRSSDSGKRQSPVPPAFTPTELEEYAGLTGTDGSETLHELYEKARYSNLDCTKEDVSRLKATGRN